MRRPGFFEDLWLEDGDRRPTAAASERQQEGGTRRVSERAAHHGDLASSASTAITRHVADRSSVTLRVRGIRAFRMRSVTDIGAMSWVPSEASAPGVHEDLGSSMCLRGAERVSTEFGTSAMGKART